MPHIEGSAKQAIDLLVKANEADPENEPIKELLDFALAEAKEDDYLPVPEEKVRFEAMFNWMKKDGAEFDKLKMRYYAPDYRGVHAARDVKKGETILYVPRKEIITLEMAMESPIGAKMKVKNHRSRLISPKHSFLATYIMQDRRKEKSYYDEYIDILPKAFDNFPIFYTMEERKWLEGSPFQQQISEKIKDIKADYKTICDEVPEYTQFDLKEYSEIRMMVCSRIFGIDIEGTKTDGFVPYADMLNHKRPRQTSWTYTDDREGFIIEALEDIKRGDQIYDSYGKKCNTRFLLNYGFINLDNDANEYPLNVELDTFDVNHQQKVEILSGTTKRLFRVQADLEEPIVSRFISFVRFQVFDENIALLHQIKSQWLQKKKQMAEDSDDPDFSTQQFQGDSIPAISKRNEKRTFEKIKAMCEAALADYPQSYEEDLEILKNDDPPMSKLTFNERNMVLFRSGEKYILHFFIKLADIVLRLIDQKLKDAKKTT